MLQRNVFNVWEQLICFMIIFCSQRLAEVQVRFYTGVHKTGDWGQRSSQKPLFTRYDYTHYFHMLGGLS